MLTKMLFGSYKLHLKYVVAFAKLAKYGGIRAVLGVFVWGVADVFYGQWLVLSGKLALVAAYCGRERQLSRKKVFTLQAVRMMFGRDRITKDEQPERFSPSGGMHKCAACGQTNVFSNIQKSTTS